MKTLINFKTNMSNEMAPTAAKGRLFEDHSIFMRY